MRVKSVPFISLSGLSSCTWPQAVGLSLPSARPHESSDHKPSNQSFPTSIQTSAPTRARSRLAGLERGPGPGPAGLVRLVQRKAAWAGWEGAEGGHPRGQGPGRGQQSPLDPGAALGPAAGSGHPGGGGQPVPRSRLCAGAASRVPRPRRPGSPGGLGPGRAARLQALGAHPAQTRAASDWTEPPPPHSDPSVTGCRGPAAPEPPGTSAGRRGWAAS